MLSMCGQAIPFKLGKIRVIQPESARAALWILTDMLLFSTDAKFQKQAIKHMMAINFKILERPEAYSLPLPD